MQILNRSIYLEKDIVQCEGSECSDGSSRSYRLPSGPDVKCSWDQKHTKSQPATLLPGTRNAPRHHGYYNVRITFIFSYDSISSREIPKSGKSQGTAACTSRHSYVAPSADSTALYSIDVSPIRKKNKKTALICRLWQRPRPEAEYFMNLNLFVFSTTSHL